MSVILPREGARYAEPALPPPGTRTDGLRPRTENHAIQPLIYGRAVTFSPLVDRRVCGVDLDDAPQAGERSDD